MLQPKVIDRRAWPLRGWLVIRLAGHAVAGLVTTWVKFPSASRAQQIALVKKWSRRLVEIAGVEIRVVGHLPVAKRAVLVANHISWVDIFAINALRPASFIAKEELSRWPVAGRLLRNVGTVFIDRSKRRDTGRVGRMLAAHLEQGETLAFFPEGRVSHGVGVHAFHGSLLQPAIDAKATIVPIAISYAPLSAFDYVNRTFLQSVWSVVGARKASITLTILPTQEGDDRRELAKSLETAIRSQITRVADATAPETKPHHPAEGP
jgi:1-acyl-sn-glycerol-3-phosphate acyltransferase